MKTLIVGIVVGILLLVAGERSYRAYIWKQAADAALARSEQAFTYLAEPVSTDEKGNKISRAQVMDAVVQNVLAQQKEK